MSERSIAALAEVNPPLRRIVRDDDQVSFVSMSDVRESGGIRTSREVSFKSVKAGFTRFQDGDVLFAKITPCMENGKGALASGLENGIGCGSTEFHVLRARPENSSAFVYQLLQWRVLRQRAELFMSGSAGQQRVPAEFFGRQMVFAPSAAAQRKIAAILTSFDTAIEKTEALIEKHQQIKAGLMRDLFTRGVLPSGQLRPSREQAPELYRETAAGWFPEDWSAETLESLLAPVANNVRSGPFGSALLKHELVENGIPFLGIDNVHVEEFRRDFKRFVSARKFRELSRYRVRPRDVIITIMGTVGRCCVVPDDLEIALSSKHLWTMTFDVERVIPELIGWQLNHAEWAKAWFRRCVQGGVMDAIQSSTLKTLKLPLPGIDEQRRIFARYEGAQSQVQRSRAQLTKLQQQKLGLMQDLLTGKVRVNATEHGVPA